MKIGVMGTGFGQVHAKIYKNLDDVKSITIFGRNKEKLNKIHEDLGIKVTDNANALLTDQSIDLIDICLPSPLHREYVIEALKNGKDVFCETPVCLTLDDIYAMKEAEEKYGRRVFVNLFIKCSYPYEYLYSTYQNNTLGRLNALYVKRETPPFWGDLSLNHIVTNLMIHEFDFITWLLGMPDKISSSGINGKDGQSHVNALLDYQDTIVEVTGSSMLPHSHPFAVGYKAVFEKGTLEYTENGFADKCERALTLFTDSGIEAIEIIQKDCYEQTIKQVIACCMKNSPTILSLEEAAQSLKLALQIKDLVLKK